MRYPDLEKRVRKLEKRITDCRDKLHLVFVRPGQDRDEEIAKLGPLDASDDVLTVTFVRAADVRPPATLQ